LGANDRQRVRSLSDVRSANYRRAREESVLQWEKSWGRTKKKQELGHGLKKGDLPEGLRNPAKVLGEIPLGGELVSGERSPRRVRSGLVAEKAAQPRRKET